jgi:hypothetical protein
MRRSPIAPAAVLIATVAILASAPTGAAGAATVTGTGAVYLVVGVAGGPMTIVVDSTQVRADAPAGSVIGPLRLPAGEHLVEFRTGGSAPADARFAVRAGDDMDVVAHRAADRARTPVVTVFRNDLSPVAPGKTRLVVSHVAVAPPSDIRVDGRPLFRNVANGESLSLVVPARSYSVDVVPTVSGGGPILGPIQVRLAAGTMTRVFAIGSVADGSTDAIVQEVRVPVAGAVVPRSVHTGDGGQAADEFVGDPVAASPAVPASPAPASPVPTVGAGVLLALLAVAGGIRRRTPRLRLPRR